MLLIGSENRRPRAENPRTSKDISLSPCVRSSVSVKIFSLHFWVCLCYCWPVLLAKCSLRPWPGGLVDIFHRLLLWPQFMMRIGRSALHLPVHILRLTFMVGSVASPGLTRFSGLDLLELLPMVRCLMSTTKGVECVAGMPAGRLMSLGRGYPTLLSTPYSENQKKGFFYFNI